MKNDLDTELEIEVELDLEMFAVETNELLQQIELLIMESENSGELDEDSMNEIYRAMHTIKGSTSMYELENISSLAHAIEDLFDSIKIDKKIILNETSLPDIIIESVDFIKKEMDKLIQDEDVDGDSKELIKKVNEILYNWNGLKGNKADNKKKKQGKSKKEKEKTLEELLESLELKEDYYKATIFFDKESQMEDAQAFVVLRDIEEIGHVIAKAPEDVFSENSAKFIRLNGLQMALTSDLNSTKIKEYIEKISLALEINVEFIDNNMVAAEKTNIESFTKNVAADNNKAKAIGQGFVNVSVEKLDALMDLVGELIISGMIVSTELQNDESQDEKKINLAESHSKIINEIQDVAMFLRMIPMRTIFTKMTRIIRDMNKKLDKNIKLKILGEETEIDKNIIDSINDPLIHLVRNAADHGIESKEERILAGKYPEGTITLDAKEVGNEVWVYVKDDGKGLDKHKIYDKAYNKGLIENAESEMSEVEIFESIFNPGFSTSENITEFSGRGVGLDVVKQSVEKIGGIVTIKSEIGIGTTFILKIPLTLAIIEGMTFKVGEGRYSLPIDTITECFKLDEDEILADSNGNEAIIFREECLPILRLHKRYDILTDVLDIREGILVAISSEEKRFCIFVDELIGEHQIVVKALPAWIENMVSGVSGCTLLSDGNISLIINPEEII